MTITATEHLSVKDTAREMRKALKAAWPTVKFSLTMSRGTGYGWLDLDWTDGPVESDVLALDGGFQDSYFDGMDDGYHRTGNARYSCCGVCSQRRYSPAAEQWARAQVVAHPGRWGHGNDPVNPSDPDYYAVRHLLHETDLTKVTL